MKHFAKITTAFCFIYILGIVIFALMTKDMNISDVDTLKLNDITQKVSENFDSLQSLDKEDFGVGFVVLDTENRLLYTYTNGVKNSEKIVAESEKMTVENAMRKRYPYRYVERDGRLVGTVIMMDGVDKGFAILRQKIIIYLCLGGVIILIGTIGLGFYVKKSIIEPFERMEEFAGKIAEGKLDEPLLMDEGNMFGAFTESFDIMREELAESKKRELELQRKEKELVASLSHDLKTPITGIKLTTELLKAKLQMNHDDRDNSDTEEKLDNIYKKADQIDVLVSDLFTSTLDDLGEFKVNCRDEESLILSEILKKNDDRDLICEGSIPKVIINIDSKRMSQVIGNIIVNSYKYADTKIDVSYRILDEYLEMKIRDYGPGAEDGELDLITNKFYRGKAAEDSRKDGSGLGLYISKSLMKKMNGELMCENADEGTGLIITLLIPLS